MREQLEGIELCLGLDVERVESLCVRIKGQATMADTVVRVCYRPPIRKRKQMKPSTDSWK